MGCSGSKEVGVDDDNEVVAPNAGKNAVTGLHCWMCSSTPCQPALDGACRGSIPSKHCVLVADAPVKDSSTRARRLSLAVEARSVRESRLS